VCCVVQAKVVVEDEAEDGEIESSSDEEELDEDPVRFRPRRAETPRLHDARMCQNTRSG
jgi:hypothetical protein